MINDFKKIKMNSILNNLSPTNDEPSKEEKAIINIQNSVIDNHTHQVNIVNSFVLLLFVAVIITLAFIFF